MESRRPGERQGFPHISGTGADTKPGAGKRGGLHRGICLPNYIGVTQLNGSGSKPLVKPGARVIAVLPRNGLAKCVSPNYNETGAHPHEGGVWFLFQVCNIYSHFAWEEAR